MLGTRAEVERFEREYVSLFAIARQRRRHFMAVKKEFQHAGVEPVFNPKKIGATFYRRANLKARRNKLKPVLQSRSRPIGSS
jgi:hypothetical protein